MASNTRHHHHWSFEQPDSGLLRLRSAPTSLFSGFFDSSGSESPALGNYSSHISSSFSFVGSPVEVLNQSVVVGYGGDSFNRLSGNSNGREEEVSFSSLLPSSLGLLSHISEQVENVKLANTNGEAQFFTSSGFPFASLDESSSFSKPFPGVKRDPDSNIRKLLSSSNQNGEIGNRVHSLSHHLSLPKNVSDITKLLQRHDSVPCQIRAKRGCATHPRSIAERVRRTRISERMRKLQELVPNLDKQMNTADMLDLAVDYIKVLQKQFKTLSDNRVKCVCLNMQKPVSN